MHIKVENIFTCVLTEEILSEPLKLCLMCNAKLYVILYYLCLLIPNIFYITINYFNKPLVSFSYRMFKLKMEFFIKTEYYFFFLVAISFSNYFEMSVYVYFDEIPRYYEFKLQN